MDLISDQITTDALKLSVEERTRLVSRLLEDMEEAEATSLSQAWVDELKCRQQDVAVGADTFDAEEVFAELRREAE